MKAERIFEDSRDFFEIMFPFVDSYIEVIVENLYNENSVNTVTAHTSDEKECVGL